MQQLSQAICFMLLNSIWQAAVLLVVYCICNIMLPSPSFAKQKKLLLLFLLVAQAIFSVVTFCVFFSSSSLDSYFNYSNNNLFNSSTINFLTNGFASLYFAIIAIKAINHLVQRRRFFLAQTVYIKPPIDIRLFTKNSAYLLGIKKSVKVWLSQNITSPVTFGFIKPVILLPVALVNNITQRQVESLILHELAHIKANDYLQNLLLIFVETIFFFNPFIITICKKLKLEREKNCDAEVINFNYSPTLYAEALLAVEKVKHHSFALFAVDNKHILLKRIIAFSLPYNAKKSNTKIAAALFSSVLFLFTIGYVTSHLNPRKKILTTTYYEQPFSASQKNIETLTVITTQPSTTVKAKINKVIKSAKQDIQMYSSKINKLTDINKVVPTNTEFDPYEIFPASLLNNNETSEVVIQEEESGTKNKTMKVIQLRFDGRNWILTPLLKIDAKEKKIASNAIKKDSIMLIKNIDSSAY